MKPFLFLFLVCLTFLFSSNIPTSIGQRDYERYLNCSNAFSCGNNSRVANLRYPFYGGNRAQYCGEEEVTCEEGVPKMSINGIKYRMNAWDNTTHQLTLAREDYLGPNGICVDGGDNTKQQQLTFGDYKNSTFDNTPFVYDQAVLTNVTLFYDCPQSPNISALFAYNCVDGRTVYYYAGNLSSDTSCTIVVLPIFRSSVPLLNSSRISEAISNGFGLRGNYQECQRCFDSGGECGSAGGLFQCICKDGSHSTSCSASISGSSPALSWRLKILIGALAAVFGVAMIITAAICYRIGNRGRFGLKWRIFMKRTKFVDSSVEVFMQSYGSLAPKRYNYSEVKRITNSFQDKLGQGGYRVVYKAKLPDDRLVAVKVISESKGSGEEFINEVASICKTSHVNIVSLLGFCYEKEKRALMYEFMPNGSLDKFIYKSGIPNAICNLDWHTLYQIAIGVARGLEYLHRGCNTRILHLDIKPQNILLDEDFCPKISDFGLAKLCQKKDSIVPLSGTRGTIGYIAPEIFSRTFGGVSHKSDVYSYGMLIIEMIGGRKNYDSGGSHASEIYFPDWIYKDLELGDIPSNCVVTTEEENEKVMKMTMVSLWCIQINPSDRPSMSKVVEMLEGPLDSLPYPPKPVMSSPVRPPPQISDVSSRNVKETNSITSQKEGPIQLNDSSK